MDEIERRVLERERLVADAILAERAVAMLRRRYPEDEHLGRWTDRGDLSQACEMLTDSAAAFRQEAERG
jgi:hypothetical protein